MGSQAFILHEAIEETDTLLWQTKKLTFGEENQAAGEEEEGRER